MLEGVNPVVNLKNTEPVTFDCLTRRVLIAMQLYYPLAYAFPIHNSVNGDQDKGYNNDSYYHAYDDLSHFISPSNDSIRRLWLLLWSFRPPAMQGKG